LDLEYCNVVATQTGTLYDSAEYIVGAHYDSKDTPGADDNASGVAGLLEIARVLSAYDTLYTIKYIAFDLEEVGLQGSKSYVEDHLSDDIRGMVNLDMIAHDSGGYKGLIACDEEDSLPLREALADALSEYGNALDVGQRGPVVSDQFYFDCENPSLCDWVTEFQACTVIEADFDSNTYIHTDDDSVDTLGYIDYDFATDMTRSVAGFLAEYAGAHTRGDCNGNGIADECDLDCSATECPAPLPPSCGEGSNCNGNDHLDKCEEGGGDCNGNDIPDLCDILSSDSQDCNGNGVPDDCEALDALSLPEDPVHLEPKHRYISINPNPGSNQHCVALKVEVAEMWRCTEDPRRACVAERYECGPGGGLCEVDADCPCGVQCELVRADSCSDASVCSNDLDKYCTDPSQCGDEPCIATGPCVDMVPDFESPLAWYVQEPVQQADDEWTATLSNTVYSEDWSAYPVLHIAGCPIVPAVTYKVYACDSATGTECGDPLEIETQKFPGGIPLKLYGDVCGGTQFPGPTVLPPDQYVNVKDLTCELWTQINYGSTTLPQMHMTWADLHGPGVGVGIPPQYILNVSDLQAVLVFSLTNGLPWVNSQGGLDPDACPNPIGGAPPPPPPPPPPGDPIQYTIVPEPQFSSSPVPVDVDVYVGAVDDLAAYELGLEVSGGDTGSLDLDTITVDDQRPDYVFYSLNETYAGNKDLGQLSNALADGSVSVTGQGYLGTFTYVPTGDANGVFTVSTRGDGFTFLLDSNGVEIASDPTASEVIEIQCVTDADCDDANECTTDTCTDGACSNVNVAEHTPCDDGLFCTVTDECDGNGTCVGSGTRCTRPRNPKCCEGTDQCICVTCMCAW
ncbi:MAG: M28 family metallopeptidase, partial [Planctomycetota bacterium]